MTQPKPSPLQDVPEGVCKLGLKIPPFWPQKPALWFAQVEGQFVVSGITADSTKFYHAIARLDQQYAAEVEDIITSPPATGKYEKLKTELIKRLSESHEKRVKQLLIHEELGDRKPSQFLRHLRALAGEGIPDSFLRTLWANRLPQNIQTVVATQKGSLDEMAELADKVYDIAPPVPVAARVDPSTSDLTQRIEELTRQVAALSDKVHHSRARNRQFSPSGNRSANPNRGRSRSRSRPRVEGYCWYHNRFRDRAQRCTTPCTYPTSTSLNGNGSRK